MPANLKRRKRSVFLAMQLAYQVPLMLAVLATALSVATALQLFSGWKDLAISVVNAVYPVGESVVGSFVDLAPTIVGFGSLALAFWIYRSNRRENTNKRAFERLHPEIQRCREILYGIPVLSEDISITQHYANDSEMLTRLSNAETMIASLADELVSCIYS